MADGLTPQQRYVLDMLFEAGPYDTRQVAADMSDNARRVGTVIAARWWGVGYDRAHSILVRLERRGLVRREKQGGKGKGNLPPLWYCTGAGKELLDASERMQG